MLKIRTAVVASALAAGLLSLGAMVFAQVASAQTVACPAGGVGGAGGNAGLTTAGNGGLAFTIGGLFGTTGSADASGGSGGSARGGTGGIGGSGTLPICNQNTNGSVAAAAPVASSSSGVASAAPGASRAAAGTGGGFSYGTGGGLANTGSRTNAELGIAGVALVLGGALLFFSVPVHRRPTDF